MDFTAHVPKDLLDLLSVFLPNRRADVRHLREGLATADFARLQRVAENMYALGNPYGFRQITTFGRLLREACAEKQRGAVSQLVREYNDYLSKVQVVEVDAPVLRSIWRDRRDAAQLEEADAEPPERESRSLPPERGSPKVWR